MAEFSDKISGYVVVAGAVNVDIGGTSLSEVVMKDSNPGIIHMSFGGVGRNIAHNLRLMDVDVKMMTAVGDDHNGRLIRSSCDEIGINMSESLLVSDVASSTYMFINDADGDMALAINDMRICERLTPAYYSGKMDIINGAEVLVLDTNLPAESVEYLANNAKVPVFADAVSTIKAVKLLPVLDKLYGIKANRAEAETLSGVAIYDEATLEKAADSLIKKGIKNVFISLGGDGMYVASGDVRGFAEPFRTDVVNTTGGGDCAMAALVRAYITGLDAIASAEHANAAASIAVSSMETIAPNVSINEIMNIMSSRS